MMVGCIRVPKADAESVRRALIEAGLLDLAHRIGCDGNDILIPVSCDSFEGRTAEDHDLPEQDRGVGDYRDIVNVPDDLRECLPASFDVIGDIAIMKLEDDRLLGYANDIGNALMKANSNIRAVFTDGGVKGEFRIRDLDRIAGTGTSETIHKESGTRMLTDPSKVYFNPRLATERARVASLVRPGEVIIDMFAGVAPFGTVICKHASPEIVYSIDLNPECKRFMEENVRMNHISNLVPIIGDASEAVKMLPKADRIIMNLPQMADEFLDSALRSVKPSGMIHMHRVLERSELETFQLALVKKMSDEGLGMRVVRVSELKTYSPTMSVYVFDITPGEFTS